MQVLDGRAALVTGGSRGIGRAICLALARAGAKVALTYRERMADAQSVVTEIRDIGAEALALRADVRDRAAVRVALGELETRWRQLDILVNNAGINKPTDFDQVSDEDWEEILSVNLKGPFICTQEAWSLLKRSGNASVIHIGSVSGQYGGPRTAHYAASKAGLISLAQVIARFGAKDGIRSNTIAAGIIASDMGSSGMAAPAVVKAAENILLRTLGSPEDVANAAVFLASDASRYITAQTINVNGGLYF